MAKAKTSITTENRSGSAADAAAKEQRTEMPLSDLHPFEGHPFKVLDDELMEQTVESIKQIGVVSPLIVRPDPEGGFEILSGHRRLHAAQLAGLETVPVIVKEMDDDAAIIFSQPISGCQRSLQRRAQACNAPVLLSSLTNRCAPSPTPGVYRTSLLRGSGQ